MSQPRLLFVLSADFGEYVTASLFSRGQDFDSHFAVPRALLPYAGSGRSGFTAYSELGEVEELARAVRPDVVVLASGYMFPVNRIARPEALAGFIERLQQQGCALATTDPWLRIGILDPESRLEIHSVKRKGVDPEATARMRELQRFLERVYADTAHLFAVPLEGDRRWLPFFNPAFAGSAPKLEPAAGESEDRWLFVLSKEDYVFLSGFESETFMETLRRRIGAVLSVARNRVTFIGPPELRALLADFSRGDARFRFVPFCDFDTFESEIRRARVAVYWNTLSSSLLYCLYYRVPLIFFGKGHQARVHPGLYEHVVARVYCGRGPVLFDAASPMEADADALVERLRLKSWLDAIAADYSASPQPAEVVQRLRNLHGSE